MQLHIRLPVVFTSISQHLLALPQDKLLTLGKCKPPHRCRPASCHSSVSGASNVWTVSKATLSFMYACSCYNATFLCPSICSVLGNEMSWFWTKKWDDSSRPTDVYVPTPVSLLQTLLRRPTGTTRHQWRIQKFIFWGPFPPKKIWWPLCRPRPYPGSATARHDTWSFTTDWLAMLYMLFVLPTLMRPTIKCHQFRSYALGLTGVGYGLWKLWWQNKSKLSQGGTKTQKVCYMTVAI